MDNNSYPLARPLFMYSDASIMQEKPQVAAYINFFLTYVNEEIVDVGYFPRQRGRLAEAQQAGSRRWTSSSYLLATLGEEVSIVLSDRC